MGNGLKDLRYLDFSLSVLCIFLPRGGVIYINKQKGLEYHIEYFQELYKNNLFVREVLSNIDFHYYRHNQTKVYSEIVPLFQLSGCFVYMNMASNIIHPTNMALFYLIENPTFEQKEMMEFGKDKLKNIEFFDIAKLNIETQENVTLLDDSDYGKPNANVLYHILESLEIDNNLKK